MLLCQATFDYPVADEVVEGVKKHANHTGGAKYLQKRFGTRVILSAPDWDSLNRGPEAGGYEAGRDGVASRQKSTMSATKSAKASHTAAAPAHS